MVQFMVRMYRCKVQWVIRESLLLISKFYFNSFPKNSGHHQHYGRVPSIGLTFLGQIARRLWPEASHRIHAQYGPWLFWYKNKKESLKLKRHEKVFYFLFIKKKVNKQETNWRIWCITLSFVLHAFSCYYWTIITIMKSTAKWRPIRRSK